MEARRWGWGVAGAHYSAAFYKRPRRGPWLSIVCTRCIWDRACGSLVLGCGAASYTTPGGTQ
eukprot:458205-Pyramimonas_sp.AAC.1